MIKRGWFLLLAATTIIVAGSCDNTRVYDKFNEIPTSGWHKESLISFTFDVSDTINPHHLYIKVRNDIDYMYSNLWLFIDYEPVGKNAETDTFEIMLAEPSGRWLGQGLGGVKTIRKEYRPEITFPASGEYAIHIGHGMRDETLQGIRDIGIRLEKAE